jgi:hypothetical protein
MADIALASFLPNTSPLEILESREDVTANGVVVWRCGGGPAVHQCFSPSCSPDAQKGDAPEFVVAMAGHNKE